MALSRRHQQGISLYIVLIIVLLSMLLALWASRTSLFNEMIIGNDADYQRAYEAAEAMIQDAELDIRGELPDGTACAPIAGKTDVCRVTTPVWFIDELPKFGDLQAILEAQPTGCISGICMKRTGNQDFWNDKTTLNAMLANGIGARYGQYTGAQTGSASNPILNNNNDNQGAWYWVEIMLYDTSPGGGLLAGKPKIDLNLKLPVVYRITAVARGLKPNTQVVLQSTFARQKLKN
ncbi:MAG: pilus assembly PilX family protein [Polaromonas sp.]